MKNVMKKVIKKVAILAAAVSIVGVTAQAAAFNDVAGDAWYYEPVSYVSDKGIMTGYDNGNFGPTDILTRGQFATVLYRISGSPEVTFDGRFPDVSGGVFYAAASIWASENKVITGYDNGNFGGNDNITREQVATILYRYAPLAGKDNTNTIDYSEFPDAGSVSPFAQNGISYVIGSSIITGDQGNINPGGYTNRAVCATILKRFMESAPHTHNWMPHTATKDVWVPNIVTVDDYETQAAHAYDTQCNDCGVFFDGFDGIEACGDHQFATGHKGYQTVDCPHITQVVIGSHTEDHGYNETQSYTDYYYCDCGATK